MKRNFVASTVHRVYAAPGDWFFNMSTENQQDYVDEHPDSIYAPHVGKDKAPKGGVKPKPAPKPKPKPKPDEEDTEEDTEDDTEPKPKPKKSSTPRPASDPSKPNYGRKLIALKKKYEFYKEQIDQVGVSQDKVQASIDRITEALKAKRDSKSVGMKILKTLFIRGGNRLKALKAQKADLAALQKKLTARFHEVRKAIAAMTKEIKRAKKKAQK